MGIDKKEDIIQPFEKTKPERFGEKVEVVRRLAMKVSIVLAKKRDKGGRILIINCWRKSINVKC
jgi:hypothetical protein